MMIRATCMAFFTMLMAAGDVEEDFKAAHEGIDNAQATTEAELAARDQEISELTAVTTTYAAVIDQQATTIAELQAQLAACEAASEGESGAVSAGAILLAECLSADGLAYGAEHGAIVVPCLYEDVVGPVRDGVIDEAIVAAKLDWKCPDPYYDGLIVLDIEQPLFDRFNSADPAVRREAELIALRDVYYVKYLRPLAQVAWWGWPNLPQKLTDANGKRYWWSDAPPELRDEAWARLAESKLGDALDWLLPAAYCMYPKPNTWYWTRFSASTVARCELAVEIAEGRPVALCVSPVSQLHWPSGGVTKSVIAMPLWREYIGLADGASVGVGWWNNKAAQPLTRAQEAERIDAMIKVTGAD